MLRVARPWGPESRPVKKASTWPLDSVSRLRINWKWVSCCHLITEIKKALFHTRLEFTCKNHRCVELYRFLDILPVKLTRKGHVSLAPRVYHFWPCPVRLLIFFLYPDYPGTAFGQNRDFYPDLSPTSGVRPKFAIFIRTFKWPLREFWRVLAKFKRLFWGLVCWSGQNPGVYSGILSATVIGRGETPPSTMWGFQIVTQS